MRWFESCMCISKSSHRRGSSFRLKPGEDCLFRSESVRSSRGFDGDAEVEKSRDDAGNGEAFPKSILKKSGGSGAKEADRGRVKWMDNLGKKLVEIREFEPVSPPSPHFLGSDSDYQHRHLRQYSSILRQIKARPRQVVVSISPREPQWPSLLQCLPPLAPSSSRGTRLSNDEPPLQKGRTPISPLMDPSEGPRTKWRPTRMAPTLTLENPIHAPLIKPQHPSREVRKTYLTDSQGTACSFDSKHQLCYPLLQRVSSLPPSFNFVRHSQPHPSPRPKSSSSVFKLPTGR